MKNWSGNKIFYGAVVLTRFECLKRYYNEFSEYIKGQLASIENVPAQLNFEDEKIKNRYFDKYAEDHVQIKKILEDNFSKSILIILYSFIEYNVTFICEKLNFDLDISEYKKPKQSIVKKISKISNEKIGN